MPIATRPAKQGGCGGYWELAPNIRYIECCNEIDIANFGLLNAEEYVKIYLRAHHAIRRLNEKHKYEIPLEIGGFGMAHPLENFPLMERVMELLKESGADGEVYQAAEELINSVR